MREGLEIPAILSCPVLELYDCLQSVFPFQNQNSFLLPCKLKQTQNLLLQEGAYNEHIRILILKVGGGLNRQIQVGQGIYQGCPFSGQLYTQATEALPRVQGVAPPGVGLHTTITSPLTTSQCLSLEIRK